MKKIYLPKSINHKSVEGVFKTIKNAAITGAQEIVLDFSPVVFCDPYGTTALASTIDGFAQAGVEMYFDGMNCNNDGVNYLNSAGFFKELSNVPNDHLEQASIPFLAIEGSNHVPFIHTTLKPWIDREVRLHNDTLETICACLTEALQNVEHHGGGLGFTLSQFYPEKKEIHFAVSDTGKGIPHQIRQIDPNISDKDALTLAIQRGVTSKTNYTNRGFGLDNLIRYTVGKNNGRVVVRSTNAKLVASQNKAGATSVVATKESNFMPGTIVHVILKTDTLEESGELRQEVFQWF